MDLLLIAVQREFLHPCHLHFPSVPEFWHLPPWGTSPGSALSHAPSITCVPPLPNCPAVCFCFTQNSSKGARVCGAATCLPFLRALRVGQLQTLWPNHHAEMIGDTVWLDWITFPVHTGLGSSATFGAVAPLYVKTFQGPTRDWSPTAQPFLCFM